MRRRAVLVVEYDGPTDSGCPLTAERWEMILEDFVKNPRVEIEEDKAL